VIDTPSAPSSKPPAGSTPPPATWTDSILFEDEAILIETSVRTPPTQTVVLTFDPILYGTHLRSFGREFLRKAGADVVAVRKKHENFYQPLSRERLRAVTAEHLARYGRKLVYGSSLGAYAALYYGWHGFDLVIASSPRISVHPRHGVAHWQRKVAFRHEPFSASQPATSPAIILFDPKDAQDRAFIEGELLPAWHHAEVIRVPYSGHPSNQFLSEIHFVAPFVRSLIRQSPRPKLDRRPRKATSPMYLQVLADHCLRRKKLHWAASLAGRSVAIAPNQQAPWLILGQAELGRGRPAPARDALERFLGFQPDHAVARRLLAEAEARLREPDDEDPVETQASGPRLASSPWRLVGRRLLRAARRGLGLKGGVGREEVRWAYRALLGREPESETVIGDQMHSATFRELIERIAASPEYQRRVNASQGQGPVLLRRRSGPTLLVSGNCNTAGLAAALHRLTDAEKVHAVPIGLVDERTARERLAPLAERADVWIVTPANRFARAMFEERHAEGARLLVVPPIQFTAFHPDCCYAGDRRSGRATARAYNSAIVAWAYARGLDVARTAALFRTDVLRQLGYLDAWDPAVRALRRAFLATDLAPDFATFLRRVQRQGCFMHTINHPRIATLVELAKLAAQRADLPIRRSVEPGELADGLNGLSWPLYPDVASALALPGGGYHWKFIASDEFIDGLEPYIEDSFAAYRAQGIAPADLEIRYRDTKTLERVLLEAAA
jgi:hypothetical protein